MRVASLSTRAEREGGNRMRVARFFEPNMGRMADNHNWHGNC